MAIDDSIEEGDFVYNCHGVKVVVDPLSVNYIKGASVDYVEDVMGGVDELLENTDEYLPQYEGETDMSYKLRTKTATFNNYTRKAVKIMTGMVFEKEIDLSGEARGMYLITITADGEKLTRKLTLR